MSDINDNPVDGGPVTTGDGVDLPVFFNALAAAEASEVTE